jgi:hypothetical protein
MERVSTNDSANVDSLYGVALDLPPPERKHRKVGRNAMVTILLSENQRKKPGRKRRNPDAAAELVENARKDFRQAERERRQQQAQRATRER